MTNAELIDLFRNVERSNYPVCNGCPMKYTCGKKKITRCLFGAAADALEAAEQRIDELENDKTNLEAEIINLEIALDKAHCELVRCEDETVTDCHALNGKEKGEQE